MSNKGRFYDSSDKGFPEVTNYNYETNIPIRGIDNRQFRWEDVAVETVYMFKEATSGGNFQDNSVVGNYGITNITGVNLITSANTEDNSSYIGWVLSGASTVYIGISGIYVPAGSLTSTTGGFQAHPLQSDDAIGLFNDPTPSLSNPSITSNRLQTGLEGPIINNNDHQVYLVAKLNYGSTGQLEAYVRGYTGNQVVCYFDIVSGAWSTGVPTGTFALGESRITEIKYNFSTSSFPGDTPTTYDLFVANPTESTFVTVDDIHIDAYMARNAFIDYIVPTGYMLQITPDLGWHNIMELFEGTKESFINPHLKTLGPYIVDLGNLVDNLDNSVTAIVDEADLLNSTTNNFKRYLWRALPLTPNGQQGKGGYPQRFEYIGDELNLLFTVDDVQKDDTSSVRIITGSKSKRMKVSVDDNLNHPNIEYPTPTTWKLTIYLVTSKRTISLQGVDSGGGTTSIIKLNLENELYNQNSMALWNVFDEHGLVTDLQRLPNESNYDFSARIKNAYTDRSSPTFVGIVNGAVRELGLDKTSDAITFTIAKNEYNHPLASEVNVEVTSYSIRIHTPSMFVEEKLLVDPIQNTVELSYLPFDLPEAASQENAAIIPIAVIDQQLIFDDYRTAYKYKINSDSASGKLINVKYSYSKEFLFKNYPTLQELIVAINSFVETSNNKVVEARLSDKLSGNESCLGLYISSILITPEEGTSISWSPIYFKRISDRGYRDYFITNEEDIRHSKYYSYVQELKNSTKIFWGSVEADRTRWDCADSKDLSMDSIPTLFDPPLTKYVSLNTGAETRIEAVTAWGRNLIGFSKETMANMGIPYTYFQPGVAHTNDLRPSIYTTTSNIVASSSLEDNVGPIKNNNEVVLFSGQR